MEIWMDRIDPHGMGGIGPYTMPLHSPPLQDHGHSASKGPQWVEYGDLGSLWRRGGGSWLQNMSGVRCGFGGGQGQGLLPCHHLSLSVHRLHNTSASLSTSAILPLPMASPRISRAGPVAGERSGYNNYRPDEALGNNNSLPNEVLGNNNYDPDKMLGLNYLWSGKWLEIINHASPRVGQDIIIILPGSTGPPLYLFSNPLSLSIPYPCKYLHSHLLCLQPMA